MSIRIKNCGSNTRHRRRRCRKSLAWAEKPHNIARMAKMDITAATFDAYKITWAERRYFLRLAAVPFFLKLFCFALASSFAGEAEQYLRFTLILLPALLAEGWMVSHIARLIGLGQRWPFQPTGDIESDMVMLHTRARGIIAGMIVYVLMNMVMGAVIAFVAVYIAPYMPSDPDQTAVEIPPMIAFASALLLGLLVFGFRFGWLNIAYALGLDWRDYVRPLRGWMVSIQFIALWILAFAPIYIVVRLLLTLLLPLAQGLAGDMGQNFVIIIVTVLADSLKAIVMTLAMGTAWLSVFRKTPKL